MSGQEFWAREERWLSAVPEQRTEEPAEQHDRDAWLDRLWSDPVYTPVDSIADRAASADDAVDWERVRGAVRRIRPVRTLVACGLGVLPAMWWAHGVAVPLSVGMSVDTAWAAGVLGAGIGAVGFAAGGRVRRWVSAALLMAAVGGTLIAEPTRDLVAAWVVGA